MSNMGQELEKRLDENKYEIWKVLKFTVTAKTSIEIAQSMIMANNLVKKVEGGDQ